MTIEKLTFKDADRLGIRKAQHLFDNHWGVSVLKADKGSKADGSGIIYSSVEPRTYEVAVIVGYNSNDWTLADNRPKKIPSDEWPVFAHLNEEDVDSLMERVSNFEPPF
jgi:hypothetical protein|tara:strand:- start:2651 stop:2977 length:327 start_codon:yes stop_codon:yes gene_type:complete